MEVDEFDYDGTTYDDHQETGNITSCPDENLYERPEGFLPETSPSAPRLEDALVVRPGRMTTKISEKVNKRIKCIYVFTMVETILLLGMFATLSVMYNDLRKESSAAVPCAVPEDCYTTETTVVHSTNQTRNVSSPRTAAQRGILLEAGWYSASDKVLYKLFKNKSNYSDAKNSCEQHGGQLLSKGLRNGVIFRDLLRANIIVEGVWIGFDDLKTEGNWVWADGGCTNVSVVAWAATQPDNYKNNEDCSSYLERYYSKAIINDRPCSDKQSYVCEV